MYTINKVLFQARDPEDSVFECRDRDKRAYLAAELAPRDEIPSPQVGEALVALLFHNIGWLEDPLKAVCNREQERYFPQRHDNQTRLRAEECPSRWGSRADGCRRRKSEDARTLRKATPEKRPCRRVYS